MLVVVTILSCSFSALRALSDDAVVNSIKAYSDLTQSDADKLKLLWLGFLAEPTVMAASAYGIYRGGKAAQEFTPAINEKLNKVFQSQIYSSFLNRPSETVQNLIKNKWTWAGIGAVGAGIAAYKLLYPRVQAGLVNKIQRYIELCQTLAVTQYHADSNSFNKSLQQPGNTVWAISSFIAIDYGFNNLIKQADIALLLIDQLLKSGGNFEVSKVDQMRHDIIGIRTNLIHNQQFIKSGLDKQLQARARERFEYSKQLDIQSKEAGIEGQRVKNVTNQWRLLKDIGETAGSIIGAFFPEDVKPVVKEYGPAAVLGVAAWKGYNWMYPGQQTQSVQSIPTE